MSLLRNRIVRGYAVLLLGVLLLVVRRLIAPDILDLEFARLDASFYLITTNCYTVPSFFYCSDVIIVSVTAVAYVIALGWRSFLGFLVAIALVIPALALYFFVVSIWIVLVTFLIAPPLAYVIMDVGIPRLLEAEQDRLTATAEGPQAEEA